MGKVLKTRIKIISSGIVLGVPFSIKGWKALISASAEVDIVSAAMVYFMLIMICYSLVANSSYLYNRISRLFVAPLQMGLGN